MEQLKALSYMHATTHTKINVQRIYLGRQIYGQEKQFWSQTQHFTIIANKNSGRKFFV